MLSVKIIRVIKDFITTNEIQYKHNSFLLTKLKYTNRRHRGSRQNERQPVPKILKIFHKDKNNNKHI